MPRRCTACDHLERHSIDEALVTGAPYRGVAKRFGLSESAVYRHKSEHLPAHIWKAREVEEAARADDLLEEASNVQAHALGILERTEKAGDLRTALAAISQAPGILCVPTSPPSHKSCKEKRTDGRRNAVKGRAGLLPWLPQVRVRRRLPQRAKPTNRRDHGSYPGVVVGGHGSKGEGARANEPMHRN
jgi:hypothetical protein